MFDDDDGVEPHFKAIDNYYFEDADDEDVCFSMLPFQFEENEEMESCDSKTEVYLRGFGDKHDEKFVKLSAWRVELEGEQPEIFVLSKGNWIKLLKPRKIHAKKVFGSILITVQMLHFARNHPQELSNNYDCLWNHLHEVFSKFGIKPTMSDLRKHDSLIKLFAKRDPILMKTKILQKFENGCLISQKAIGTQEQFVVDDKKGYISNGDNDCVEESDDDNDDSCDEEYNKDDDDSNDGHSDDDDGADPICAICDDGGKLLSCKGQCKRAFHATKKHGRRSKCITLGYTSAQRKKIGTFICKNCEYEQHRCFKCGELEPSNEANAKVFRCNMASCGHFYHPKCIAKLLEPDDTIGACVLEKRITTGMPFTCPVHWCFKCEQMEDRTKNAFHLAVCRLCPRSYHRTCLPREISLFKMKQKRVEHGATTWESHHINFFYCLSCSDHMDKATIKARRDRVKFPPFPITSETSNHANKKVKLTGKRKSDADQLLTRPTELSKKLQRRKREHIQSVSTDSSSSQIPLEHACATPEQTLEAVCATNHLKEDMQFQPSCIKATADLSSLGTVEGQEKQCVTLFADEGTQIRTPDVLGSDVDKRIIIPAEKKISSVLPHEVSRKSLMPSSRSSFFHSIQENMEAAGNNHRILSDDKDDNGCEKTSDHYSVIEVEHDQDRDNSDENNEPNDKNNDQIRDIEKSKSSTQSGNEKVMEWAEIAKAHEPPSQPAQEIIRMENPIYADNSERDSRSNGEKIVITDRCKSGLDDGSAWPDPSHDHCSEKQVHDVHADNVMSITDRTDTRQEFGCHENLEGNKTYASLKEQNSTHHNDNGMGMVRERREDNDGKKVELDTNIEDVITIHPQVSSSNQCLPNHNELDVMDTQVNSLQCNDENRAAEIAEDESREMILTNRREELLVHNLRYALDNSPSGRDRSEKSRNDSLEWQQSYYHDSFPINNYRHGYEQWDPVECSCIDYFSCRKYCPLLGEYGIIKYGGYHAMEISPAIRCSLQDNINSSFGRCIDVLTGSVYGGRNSMYGMSSVGSCGGTVGTCAPPTSWNIPE